MAKKTHINNDTFWLKRPLGALGAIVATVLVVLGATSVYAQICEFPLPIMRNVPDGNVLFILDSSTSMNEIVYHSDYDAFVTYGGSLHNAETYTVKQDGMFAPDDFENGAVSSPEIFLIKSDNSKAGLYSGNYLNWLYFHASPEQVAAMPLITRIQAGKAVVAKLVLEHEQIRFGVMKFNGSNSGGTLVAKVGSPRENLINQTMGIAANGSTPIAETMITAEEYFRGTGQTEVIQYECQQTFMVILTDGYPTSDTNVPSYIGDQDGDGNEPGDCESIGAPYPNSFGCSDYMDDVAAYLHKTDMRDDLDGLQNISTYVVGYYIDAPLLAETAQNGGGLFFTARSTEELNRALDNVLRDIIQRISAGSAVAVISSEDQNDDLLFRSKYLPVKWQGFLEAFKLPYSDGDSPQWEAGSLLAARSSASRKMFTNIAGTMYPFSDGQASTLMYPMQLATSAEAEDVINWTRGDDVMGYRDRGGWTLGDIVHSGPVAVGPPATYSFDPSFLPFSTANQNRRRMIYFGANDAQLHALDADTGQELWSYIPNSQLFRLQNIANTAYCHEYSVDLTPRVVDAQINGQWKTLVIGGMRQGGNTYFCLDVTDPDNPEFMWETTITGLNGSWSTPAIARVPWNNGESVFIVGSGPDFTGYGAGVTVCDLTTGAFLWNAVLSVGYEVNMSTSVSLLDVNYDGHHDLAYLGDLAGNLWRMDIKQFPPTVTALYEGDQPIQSRPILTVDYNSDVFVYFGTGKYLEVSDFDNTQAQSIVCVIDKHDLQSVPRSAMIDQTSSITVLNNNDLGWYVDMQEATGERITQPAALVAGVLYATSFQPTPQLCGFGGHSWLYKLNFRTGSGADDDDDSSNDTTDNRTEDLGDGIASQPVVDIVNEKVLVQGSDTRVHVKETVGAIRIMLIRSWRTKYD